MKLWRPQSINFIISGVALVLVGLIVLFMVNNFQPTVRISVGSGVIDARTATTEAARIQGLSGVKKLGPNEGLLMVFVSDDKWPIWMKDMEFPIDIIWLDANKRVVTVTRDVSPDDQEKIYKPTVKARYVLELPAGSAANMAIKVGAQAAFTAEEAKVEP